MVDNTDARRHPYTTSIPVVHSMHA